MEYALKILVEDQKKLEKLLKQDDLMRTNMTLATTTMSNISQLKKAVKMIKNKAVKV